MADEPKLIEVLLQSTERAQLPPTEVVKFKGDPAEYFSFIRSFESRIGAKHISDQDKLFYRASLNNSRIFFPSEDVNKQNYNNGDARAESMFNAILCGTSMNHLPSCSQTK